MTETLDAPPLAGATHITDYDEISEILRSPDFVQGGFAEGTAEMIPGALITLNGRAHVERRRLFARMFTQDRVDHYIEHGILPETRSALAELRAAGTDETDLVPLSWRILHRVPAMVVGIDVDPDAEVRGRFVRYIREIAKAVTVDWQRGDHGALLAAGKAAKTRFAEEFFVPSLAARRDLVERHRRGEIAAEELPIDVVTVLLLHGDVPDEVMLHEAVGFLMASITTTAQAFPHFVVQLEDWLARHPQRRSVVQDIGFLQRAVDESLRLFVAAPARIRTATKDLVLKCSGRRIAQGQKLALWFGPANASPDFGADTEHFDPEREVRARPDWGLAFGAGAHLCIGRPIVTGVRGRGADPAPHGTMASLAKALYAAGLELVADAPATKDAGTFYDEYASLPVRFTDL